MFGYQGSILHIDVGTGRTWIEATDEDLMRVYAGGGLLSTYLLMRECRPEADPLGPDNVLVFASSVIAGYPAPGLAMHTVSAKSPLTGGIGEARAQGPFGAALKGSGCDAIVLHGCAETPTLVLVEDGRASLHTAAKMWGQGVGPTTDEIERRFGDVAVAAIGQAGENLVRYASIVSNRTFEAARMGMGAVMGSKNVKAVILRGEQRPPVADPDGVARITAWYVDAMRDNAVCRTQLEPPGFAWWPIDFHRWEMSQGVHNFRRSDLPSPDAFVPEAILPWSRGVAPCTGCPNDCVKILHGDGLEDLDARSGGMFQEITGAFGPNIGNAQVRDIIRANILCHEWGLDPTSLGASLAFAMECVDVGILDEGSVGLDLRFGDSEAALEMMRRITFREGFGDVLAEGVRGASKRIDSGSDQYAMHVKGLEIPPFDPRSQTNLALGYAVSPTGPRHDICEHDNDWDPDPSVGYHPHSLQTSRTLGILGTIPMDHYGRDKVRNYRVLNNFFSAGDALDVCVFSVDPSRLLTVSKMAELVTSITGWDCSSYEVMRWGERRNHLMRVYNNREGMSPGDDDLPARFFEDGVTWGRHLGCAFDRSKFREVVNFYYEMMGWDSEGRPRPAILFDHQLEWVLQDAI